MSNQPFMQFYVGDYLADTTDLTCEEHGAYLLILMTMWRHGATLPNDPKKLARIARLSPRKWASVWSEIERFFVVDGDTVSNARLTKEYKKARVKSDLRAQAGSMGGKAKALKNNKPPIANASDLPKQGQKSEVRDKKREGKPSQKKGTRLPADWALPRDWGDWAISEGWPDRSIRIEAEKFRDYWHSVAGQKGVKLDWKATWRNWMRNSSTPQILNGGRNDQSHSNSDRPSHRTDPALEQIARLAGLGKA